MADTINYMSDHHDLSLADFERHYADLLARRQAAQTKFDEAAKQNAADETTGVMEKIRRHKALQIRHGKETAALNAEIVEMNRIRENANMMYGEKMYNKYSQKGKEVAI